MPGKSTKSNFTGRIARWSATHRKRAIWGWLGFVFALLVLIMGARVVEQKDISTVDSFSGESQQAERALTDAGLRPNEEVVLIQSKDSTATDPQFQALIECASFVNFRRIEVGELSILTLMFDDHFARRANYDNQIWGFVTFMTWYQDYIAIANAVEDAARAATR